MACANFCQVSCFAAVSAHLVGCYLAVFERVDCAATSSAFPLEERVSELFLWGSIVWALVFGLKLAFISLIVRSSVKAGGMSPLSSLPSRAGATCGGMLDVLGA